MAQDKNTQKPKPTRLASFYVRADKDSDIEADAVMLFEMVGDQVETVSLRLASDAMRKWVTGS